MECLSLHMLASGLGPPAGAYPVDCYTPYMSWVPHMWRDMEGLVTKSEVALYHW